MQQFALYLAAAIMLLIGGVHSFMGEKYVLQRLARRENLPKLFGSVEMMMRLLRLAWHITTAAWFGYAAILLLLAHPPVSANAIALAISATFFLHGCVSLIGARGKHYSWIAFFAIALLAFYAA